ncbi:SAYSvFN domain-containing protein 1 [Nerophis ophidion]|uniref:SAYSvFN domain-containing protein 1 n=1 Tax=Nerophis ophidion TaxID=159077 RepID=UPI002ADF4BD8|nr:SAYSvFN domain-containing protein 1 [Nerophis ophidion]
MEQKLAEFRARRQAEKRDDDEHKDTLEKETESVKQLEPLEHSLGKNSQTQGGKDRLPDSAHGSGLARRKYVTSSITWLKVLLWVVLLGFFSELEFGLAFFLTSLFYWLYAGLRSPSARRPGEMSAYSVFNPNCQPLLGTLTAEQLEGEMGYRPQAHT